MRLTSSLTQGASKHDDTCNHEDTRKGSRNSASACLSYGTTEGAKLEIFCDKDSQIVVPEPGRVKPSGTVVFTYVEGGKATSITLDTEVCGVDGLT